MFTFSTEDLTLASKILEVVKAHQKPVYPDADFSIPGVEILAGSELDEVVNQAGADADNAAWEAAGELGYVALFAAIEAEEAGTCTKSADTREELAKVLQLQQEGRKLRDPFAAPVPAEFEQGLYHYKHDQLVYVYRAQAGHWLAKLVGPAPFYHLEYLGAAGRYTQPDRQLSVQEHVAFGALAPWCGFCSTSLSDPDSQRLGYGPKCASKHGLPHPNR